MVEIVDGALPAGWDLTRALWLRGQASADGDRGGPAKLAAKIAGIPKPRGRI